MPMRPTQALVVLLLVFPLVFGAAASVPAAPSAQKRPAPALTPSFSLPDLSGRPRTLTEFRGRPVALFFFCGCDACRRCAVTWADVQGGGVLPSVRTLIVFSGDAATARRFLAETGLDASQTVLLTDPQDRVADTYHAPVCPRAFVLDARGRLRYTNNEPGTNPQTTPTATLVSRIVSAGRAASAATANGKTSHDH